MKRPCTVLVLAAIVTACPALTAAQWALRPAPSVPKGADGKPNLTAPAPRTADGKADLSGIWMRTTRVEKPGSAPPGQPPLATMGNIGAGFKDELPYLPWAMELVKKRAGGYDNPVRCVSRRDRGSFTTIHSRERSSSCRRRR